MKTLIAAIVVCLLLAGCGSGNKANSPVNPTNSVNNGQTLATATSYWACESCIPGYAIGIEFAANGQFQTIITGTGPGSSTCVGTVTQAVPGAPTSYFLLGGSCSGMAVQGIGYPSISEIKSLSGSISSQAMSVTMTSNIDPDMTYSDCAFTLVQGQQ